MERVLWRKKGRSEVGHEIVPFQRLEWTDTRSRRGLPVYASSIINVLISETIGEGATKNG